ncbi:hypothetical protein [Corynebacterium qintianiae]|uniref:hypothetical protein n=1 Tax=Corynebacterium qintianiae TaxID=2709392 RepID=UPI0013EBB0D1|nr:hypothetical protein [Corynebacterium qintianiae]
MTYNEDDSLFLLRRANPVPDDALTPAQQARADETLEAVMAQPRVSRRPRGLPWVPWLGAAAALVLVVGLGVGVVPQQQARAQAEEALTRAAEASASKPQMASVTSADYLRRVDSIGEASVVSVLRTDASGTVEVNQEDIGDLPAELATAAGDIRGQRPLDPDADITELLNGMSVRAALEMLLSPGLTAGHQRDLYAFIAQTEGNRVVGRGSQREGNAVTIERKDEDLTFTLLPETGQLASVTNLVAPGVVTTVDAAGIVSCVNITGVAGPSDMSLTCADNNYLLTDLQWQGWNSDTAEAAGTASINDCDPDCAGGTFRTFPAEVRASEKRSCGYNLEVYTKLEVDYSEEVQRAEPLAQPETFDLGCG